MPGKSKDATNTAELKKFEFKKDKMQTKPYGIEDRKIKTEELLSQKDLAILKKEKGIGLYPSPKNKSAGKTAPPEAKFKSGGRVNLRGGGCAKRGVKKNAYGKNS
jgi:hypothetical protein